MLFTRRILWSCSQYSVWSLDSEFDDLDLVIGVWIWNSEFWSWNLVLESGSWLSDWTWRDNVIALL